MRIRRVLCAKREKLMEMMHYEHLLVDPKHNIFYGNTLKEAFVKFNYNPQKKYPLRAEMIGITYPDKDYYIERRHGDYFVLEYVESGEGYIRTENSEFKVTADSVYLLFPGKSHRYGADKKNPYKKIFINFFSDVFNQILLAYGLIDKTVFYNSGCKDLFDKLLSIAEKSNDNDEVYLDLSNVVFEIIIRLAKLNEKREDVSELARVTKEALDAAVYRKVSVEKLSEELSISKSQMTREFTRYFGISPYKYLLDKKIDVAKHLLLSTQMRVYEISELLGFSDTYYFSNLFKQKTGMSPLGYRFDRTK